MSKLELHISTASAIRIITEQIAAGTRINSSDAQAIKNWRKLTQNLLSNFDDIGEWCKQFKESYIPDLRMHNQFRVAQLPNNGGYGNSGNNTFNKNAEDLKSLTTSIDTLKVFLKMIEITPDQDS